MQLKLFAAVLLIVGARASNEKACQSNKVTGSCVENWGRCGGKGFAKGTFMACCDPEFVCTSRNDYYAQCRLRSRSKPEHWQLPVIMRDCGEGQGDGNTTEASGSIPEEDSASPPLRVATGPSQFTEEDVKDVVMATDTSEGSNSTISAPPATMQTPPPPPQRPPRGNSTTGSTTEPFTSTSQPPGPQRGTDQSPEQPQTRHTVATDAPSSGNTRFGAPSMGVVGTDAVKESPLTPPSGTPTPGAPNPQTLGSTNGESARGRRGLRRPRL